MTPAKPFYQSKTVWVQALALAATFLPPVAAWVASNPVEFVAALAALNTLVRFATHGSLSIFRDDDEHDNGGNGSGGGSGGGALPLLIATAAAGFSMAGALLLSSCAVGIDGDGNYLLRPDPHSVDAVLRHVIRHEDDAKGGLVAWEYFDPATGKKIEPADYEAWGIKTD